MRRVFLIGVLSLGLSVSAFMASPSKASAAIGACHAWQFGTYTQGRDCDVSAANAIAFQYDDYGPNDGYCVAPRMWNPNSQAYEYLIGGTTEANAGGSSFAPADCNQGGVTTFYTNRDYGNIALFRVPPSGAGSNGYNTICTSSPARPSQPSPYRPPCYNNL